MYLRIGTGWRPSCGARDYVNDCHQNPQMINTHRASGGLAAVAFYTFEGGLEGIPGLHRCLWGRAIVNCRPHRRPWAAPTPAGMIMPTSAGGGRAYRADVRGDDSAGTQQLLAYFLDCCFSCWFSFFVFSLCDGR